jgi:histidine phosphotransferase ChpT
MSQSIDLAALLCSRLCHDMLSPVGALSNGIELLRDERDPEMRQRCLELLEQSARISTDKLKFFRLAYGAAGGFGEDVPVEEPRQLIEALVANNGRIELAWAVAEATLPKPAVKVLLNLAAIAIDALPRGGQLDIGAERRGGATEIAVRAAGGKIAFDETIGGALEGTLSPVELSGRTAPAYMIRQIAEGAGGGLQYAVTDEALVMGALLPDA